MVFSIHALDLWVSRTASAGVAVMHSTELQLFIPPGLLIIQAFLWRVYYPGKDIFYMLSPNDLTYKVLLAAKREWVHSSSLSTHVPTAVCLLLCHIYGSRWRALSHLSKQRWIWISLCGTS